MTYYIIKLIWLKSIYMQIFTPPPIIRKGDNRPPYVSPFLSQYISFHRIRPFIPQPEHPTRRAQYRHHPLLPLDQQNKQIGTKLYKLLHIREHARLIRRRIMKSWVDKTSDHFKFYEFQIRWVAYVSLLSMGHSLNDSLSKSLSGAFSVSLLDQGH